MFLLEPQRTQYDLHFTLFGTPVRVHPMFWVVSLLMGFKLEQPVLLLMWTGVVFFSILIHEMGHVVAYKYFGMPADVVLYSFGGLAIARRYSFRGHWAQVLISFAGPLAGFLVAGLVFACLHAARVPYGIGFGFPEIVRYGVMPFEPFNLYLLVDFLLQVNLYWGLVNLLPIYPLDGGQIARALLQQYDVPDAVRKSLILSIAAAGFMVLVGLRTGDTYVAIMFGFLGYQSYVDLSQSRGGYRGSPW